MIQKIDGFCFYNQKMIQEGIGPGISYTGWPSTHIAWGVFYKNAHHSVLLDEVRGFYLIPSRESDSSEIKICMQDFKIDSLGITKDIENARRWVREANSLLYN